MSNFLDYLSQNSQFDNTSDTATTIIVSSQFNHCLSRKDRGALPIEREHTDTSCQRLPSQFPRRRGELEFATQRTFMQRQDCARIIAWVAESLCTCLAYPMLYLAIARKNIYWTVQQACQTSDIADNIGEATRSAEKFRVRRVAFLDFLNVRFQQCNDLFIVNRSLKFSHGYGWGWFGCITRLKKLRAISIRMSLKLMTFVMAVSTISTAKTSRFCFAPPMLVTAGL